MTEHQIRKVIIYRDFTTGVKPGRRSFTCTHSSRLLSVEVAHYSQMSDYARSGLPIGRKIIM